MTAVDPDAGVGAQGAQVGKRGARVPLAAYYYAAFAATPIMAFVQTRILTRVLSPSAVGEIQLVIPIVATCALSGGLGVPNYILRFFARDGDDVFTKGLPLSLLATTLIATVMIGVAAMTTPSLPEGTTLTAMALAFLCAVTATQVFNHLKSLLRVREHHKAYNSTVVAERVLAVGCLTAAVLWSRLPPMEAYLFGSAVGTGVLVMIAWRVALPTHVRLGWPSRQRTMGILKYGLPVVATVVAGDLFASADRYVVATAGLGTTMVAQYAIGYRLARLGMQALYDPILTFIHPRIFRHWEAGEYSLARRLLTRYLVMYLAAAGVMIVICDRAEVFLIKLIADTRYLLPPHTFLIMLVAAFFGGLYRFFATHYLIQKDTAELAGVFTSALALNVGLAVVLVRSMGLIGVAIAALVSSAALAMGVWWRGKHTLHARFARDELPPVE